MKIAFPKLNKSSNVLYEATAFLLFAIFLTYSIVFSTKLFSPPHVFANPPSKVEKAADNYAILIDIEEKKLFLLNNNKLVKEYSVAIGKDETPSPLGSFKIVEKSHWGEGFGGYWMGLDCTWGQYGIHGTTKPESIGLPSSHGCFRMHSSDAAEVFEKVPCGTPVYVTGGCFAGFGQKIRTIKPYMFGKDVLMVQQKLQTLSLYDGVCNGCYDSEKMKTAVHRFQRQHGLTVSDNIGPAALKAMGLFLME